jgi:hypothetical protein
MPSPICHCISHGCGAQGGVTVELHTLKAHQRQDHAALALEARAARERIISAQEDEISTYLASMTLSDNVSCPPKRPAGVCGHEKLQTLRMQRLWQLIWLLLHRIPNRHHPPYHHPLHLATPSNHLEGLP